MNLTLPTVGVTPDPDWASNLNTAIERIDEHDHTTGNGKQVPTAGIDLDADLSFNSVNATDLRSAKLNNNVSTLPNTDVRCVYATGGNLYYNNNSGTAVQLTNGANLNVGALELNVYELETVTTNTTIVAADTFVAVSVQLSASPITITLPLANSVTAGRFYLIKDEFGSAGSFNISIEPSGTDAIDGDTNPVVIDAAFGAVFIISNGSDNWLIYSGTSMATTTSAGIIILAGDLAGSGSTGASPRVGKINGASVPVSGALTTGNVLQVSGVAALSYAALNLAGGAGYVTGELPGANMADATTGGKGAVKLAGDLAGDGSSASLPRIGNITGMGASGGNPAYVNVECNVVLKKGLELNSSVVVTGASHTILTTEPIVLVQTDVAVTLTLPISSRNLMVYIKDYYGSAGTNNITIQTTGKIDGLTSDYIMSTDYGSLTLWNDGTDWWSL